MAYIENIEWKHLSQVLEDFATYLIQVARDNLSKNGTNASGTLADSMDYKIVIGEDRFTVYILMESYWDYVEFGRKPGRRPPIWKIMEWIMVKPVQVTARTPSVESLSFAIQKSLKDKNGYAPPAEALQRWIEKKGIQPQPALPSVESLAWAIATNIGKYGTKPQPFFESAKQAAIMKYETPIYLAIREDMETYLRKQLEDFYDLFK